IEPDPFHVKLDVLVRRVGRRGPIKILVVRVRSQIRHLDHHDLTAYQSDHLSFAHVRLRQENRDREGHRAPTCPYGRQGHQGIQGRKCLVFIPPPCRPSCPCRGGPGGWCP